MDWLYIQNFIGMGVIVQTDVKEYSIINLPLTNCDCACHFMELLHKLRLCTILKSTYVTSQEMYWDGVEFHTDYVSVDITYV